MNEDRYPHTAQLAQLQGLIRGWLPKLAKERGAGRDVFHIANSALARPTLPKSSFAVAAILYWFTERKVLPQPVPKLAAQPQGPRAEVRIVKARGHATKAPKAGRARRLERDGIGLGSISR